jgi:hypothetical protein
MRARFMELPAKALSRRGVTICGSANDRQAQTGSGGSPAAVGPLADVRQMQRRDLDLKVSNSSALPNLLGSDQEEDVSRSDGSARISG